MDIYIFFFFVYLFVYLFIKKKYIYIYTYIYATTLLYFCTRGKVVLLDGDKKNEKKPMKGGRLFRTKTIATGTQGSMISTTITTTIEDCDLGIVWEMSPKGRVGVFSTPPASSVWHDSGFAPAGRWG